MKNNSVTKTIKPSQRESISGYTKSFALKDNADSKMKIRRLISIIIALLCIFALVYVGFFFSDLIIKFSELPASIQSTPEAAVAWTSYLTIRA